MGKKINWVKSSAVLASIIGAIFSVILTLSSANFTPSSYNKTAGELREAREAMWRGMNSLEKLEKDLSSKAASYDEIKLRLEALEKTEKLSKDELKSTLDAIGYTRSWFDWRNVLLGFFLGVLSSVVASILMTAIPNWSKGLPKNIVPTGEK